MPTTRYALRFISGKYQGGEFPLPREREFVIGRSTEADMILIEDMVSRRHARVVPVEEDFELEDLSSTNGTFVNGEKIRRTRLKEGDRILIGTSILRLIPAEGTSASDAEAFEARRQLVQSAARHITNAGMRMTGVIEEIPLPDLIQLLATSRKSGVLVVQTDRGQGRIYFRRGQLYHAVLEHAPEVRARKAVFRMLDWAAGTFVLEPPDERHIIDELTESTEALLMEGMHALDEVKRLAARMPPAHEALSLPSPLAPPLRDLGPGDLDLLQILLNANGDVELALDRSTTTDLETMTRLLDLIDRRYLVASPGPSS